MANETENMNPTNNGQGEAGAGEQPKKKNFIRLFRPENSKTGAVKHDTHRAAAPKKRPAADGAAKAPAAKTADTAAKAPAAKPAESAAPAVKAVETAAPAAETTAKAPAAAPQTEAPARTARPQSASGERRPYNRDGQNGERRPYNRDGQNGERRPYNRDGQNGERRPYNRDGQNGERRPYNRDGQNGERRPYNRDGQNGERRPYNRDGQNGERRPYNRDGQNGERRPYNRDGQNGERRPYNRDGQGQGGSRPFNRDGQGQGGSRPFNRDGQGQGRPGMGRPAGGPGRGPARPAAGEKPIEKEGRIRNERAKGNVNDKKKQDKKDKFDRLEKNTSKQQAQRQAEKQKRQAEQKAAEEKIKSITIPEEGLTLKELADKLKQAPAQLIKKLFMAGKMVTMNDEITYEEAEEIALEYEVLCEKEVKVDVIEELLKDTEDAEEDMTSRPPVVCVMGHVDHGKTSLLDAIRQTHVTDRESGGITQAIGASVVERDGNTITFLDTPGHEAFTSMRMRGANSTDIAVLVVAADDGVMPQTVEAINHAKAAGIEIIVAINKIDKPGANVERVKQELTEYQLISEDWGGSTVFCEVSAKTGEGIENLLDMILLTADVLELKANAKRRARGLVIEARLDKGRGPVATVLIQKGTLHAGDPIAAGQYFGRIREMVDDKHRPLKVAGPSTPVEITGFNGVPSAGEILVSPENEKEARTFAETFISEGRRKLVEESKQKMSLDDLFSQIKSGNLKELNIIVKADVQGSVEAVKQSLLKLSNEEVVVKVIHSAVGAINESDVILASASNAIIIGFNVRPDAQARSTADHEGVDVRLYSVIYSAIADVEAAMKGMLDPIYEEKVIGHGEIRQIFKASGIGNIAGSYVTDGKFERGCKARVKRGEKQIFEGDVASLKRFKDDVKEVKAGYECGVVFNNFGEITEGDIIEAYIMVEVPR